MSDATGPDPAPGQQQLSEEELRAYLAQLRQAPAAEIIAQVMSLLANGAQVKLGRNDARPLIDAIEAVKNATASVLPEEFRGEIDNLLSQLRMAQVEGEQEISRRQAEGEGDASGADPQQPEPEPEPEAQQRPSGSSRLWVPGQ